MSLKTKKLIKHVAIKNKKITYLWNIPILMRQRCKKQYLQNGLGVVRYYYKLFGIKCFFITKVEPYYELNGGGGMSLALGDFITQCSSEEILKKIQNLLKKLDQDSKDNLLKIINRLKSTHNATPPPTTIN